MTQKQIAKIQKKLDSLYKLVEACPDMPKAVIDEIVELELLLEAESN